MGRLERKRLRGSSLDCWVVDAEKADGADGQPIQARVRPCANPPFSDSFSPPRRRGFIGEVGAVLKVQRWFAKPWTAAACCRFSEAALLPSKSPGCRETSPLPQARTRHGEMESWNARRPAGWPPESGSRLPQSKWLPVFDRFCTNFPDEPKSGRERRVSPLLPSPRPLPLCHSAANNVSVTTWRV